MTVAESTQTVKGQSVSGYILSAEDRAKSLEIRRQRAQERREQAAAAKRNAVEMMRDVLQDGDLCIGPFVGALQGTLEPSKAEVGMKAVDRMLAATGQLEADATAGAQRQLLEWVRGLGESGMDALRVELVERKATLEVSQSPSIEVVDP